MKPEQKVCKHCGNPIYQHRDRLNGELSPMWVHIQGNGTGWLYCTDRYHTKAEPV